MLSHLKLTSTVLVRVDDVRFLLCTAAVKAYAFLKFWNCTLSFRAAWSVEANMADPSSVSSAERRDDLIGRRVSRVSGRLPHVMSISSLWANNVEFLPFHSCISSTFTPAYVSVSFTEFPIIFSMMILDDESDLPAGYGFHARGLRDDTSLNFTIHAFLKSHLSSLFKLFRFFA